MPKLYGFYSASNTGDFNNVEALYNGVEDATLSKEGLLPDTELTRILSEASLSPQEAYTIIMVGEKGAMALNGAKIPANVQTFWTGHQTSHSLIEAVHAKKITTLSIARSGISQRDIIDFQRYTTVKTVPGVPVEVNEAAVIASYQQHQTAFLPVAAGQRRIVCQLGGDAPDLEGNRKYITEEDGFKIGGMLAELAKQHHAVIEIVNNPRTGEYDHLTGAETLAHHNLHPDTGEALPQHEDKTTRAIRHILEEQGIAFQIHDFRWGTQKLKHKVAKEAEILTTSMYNPAMGLILSDPTAIVLYTGESITEGNKCAKYLVGRDNYAISVPSQHEGHEAFADDLYDKGYVGIINLETKEVKEPGIKATTPLDATKIALRGLQEMLSPTLAHTRG